MFERFTEPARRALFFSRYEAGQRDATAIEPEHVLLGILRETESKPGGLPVHLPLGRIREQFSQPSAAGRTTRSETPFSAATKRVLELAAQEADGLGHAHIGPEHLLLGLLRDEQSPVGMMLVVEGLQLDAVRRLAGELAANAAGDEASRDTAATMLGPAAEMVKRTNGRQHLHLVAEVLEHLAQHVPFDEPGRRLLERIRRDVTELQSRLPLH